MYTKLLRRIVRKIRTMSGHCDGGNGGYGHCY